MGVTECDNMLMLLAVSTKMTEKERDVVIPLIMRGFKVCRQCFGSVLILYGSRSSILGGILIQIQIFFDQKLQCTYP
jgi:hypothetical protein